MKDDRFSPFTLDSPTGARLAVRHIAAEGMRRGVVQINHGLAEHSGRYRRFADFLAARGFHVYAHDHRGHGATTAPDAIPARFGRENGLASVIADIDAVHRRIASDHPGLPVICFGHSLGGIIALNYAETHPEVLAGLALWNANLQRGAAVHAAKAVLATETALLGSDVPSRVLPKLTFQAWGKAVPGHRTPFDWLSRDEAEVQAYIDDPLCGWDATVSMWKDIFRMIEAGPKNLGRLPSSLPVQLLAGEKDPSTAGGKAVSWLADRMMAEGMTDVSLTILPGARHETLNEVNREDAMTLFAAWAEKFAIA